MFNKMKQFKDLRKQAKTLESTLAQETAEGRGAGGNVVITMNGNQQITNVFIDPALLTPDSKTRIESGIKEALVDANKKVRDIMMKKMKSGEIEMPDFSQFQ